MNTNVLHAKLLFIVLLVFLLFTSPLYAHCLDPHESDNSGGLSMNVSGEYQAAELESTDQYLSGTAGDEDWKAVHDLDGDLYGFSISATPPVLGKRLSFDISYLSGDLSGTFNTQEIAPTPEGPYTGTVTYDYEQWEIGADVFILNAVYARLKYSTFEMDGEWVYDLGFANEAQKYEFDAYTIGVGFKQNIGSKVPNAVFEDGFGLIVDVFLGYSFFDYEHTEQLTGAKVNNDGNGYEMSIDLIGTYKLNIGMDSYIFCGVGYDYEENDDDNLDLTQDGFTAKLGVRMTF